MVLSDRSIVGCPPGRREYLLVCDACLILFGDAVSAPFLPGKGGVPREAPDFQDTESEPRGLRHS